MTHIAGYCQQNSVNLADDCQQPRTQGLSSWRGEKRPWSRDLLSKAIQDEVNKYFIFG